MDRFRRHLSYSNVVASLALFVALGGVSYAAVTLPAGSVGSKQIKRSAVTSAKVKDHSLTARDFRRGQLPAAARGPEGPPGPKGETGPQGLPGADGSSSAPADGSVSTSALAPGAVTLSKLATVNTGTVSGENTQSPKLLTLNCPAGTSILTGSAGVLQGALPAAGVAAISYDSGLPFQNGWAAEAYSTSAGSSWSLALTITCVKN